MSGQSTSVAGSDVGRGNRARLVVAQLLCGVGIASGVAVGGVLAEHLSGVMGAAGFAQTASIVGAGVMALPLARLATRFGRRWSLTIGFGTATAGAALILVAVASTQFWLYMIAMLLFGAGTATNLQSRYAAMEFSRPGAEARSMSIVLWATTIGSITGPNLSGPGGALGGVLGIDPMGGPYVFSLFGFVLAALVVCTIRPIAKSSQSRVASDAGAGGDAVEFGSHASGTAQRHGLASDRKRPAAHSSHGHLGTFAALRRAVAHPRALFALACVIGGQMMMTSVMVMTPVSMNNDGMSLEIVGIVISIHVIGMYAASPLFGWLADRIGSARVAWIGVAVFLASFVIGGWDATLGHDAMPRLMVALFLLGLGWSACLIGGSALLVESVPEQVRVPLQGASDSLMNFGAAGLGALAGPVLALGGFLGVNLMAFVVLAALALIGSRAAITRRAPPRSEAQVPSGINSR
jgi:MFS family permease